MKKLFLLLIVFNLLTPSYTQGILSRSAKSVRLLSRPSVSRWSKQANKALEEKMNRVPRTQVSPTTTLTTGHSFKHRKYPMRSTFQLQHTDSPLATSASGFAIYLHGKVWGVTTAHVAKKINPHWQHPNRRPHMRIPTGPDSFVIIPIKKFYIGNPEGMMDLALFEIPEEALPYITVLRPAKRAPIYGEEITFRGFKEDMFVTAFNNGHSKRTPLTTYLTENPGANKRSLFNNSKYKIEIESQAVTLEHQKVVFSTPNRLFLKNPPAEEIIGLCGAPGFTNGLVSSVYAGFDISKILMQYDWFKNLPAETQRSMLNMQYAIPIEAVESMAKSLEKTGSISEAGTMMRVFGRPVALLHANEAIAHIEQFRNGEKIAKIDGGRHAPINPEKLELFFDLQQDDVLRITLDSFSTEHPMPSVAYDVNASTGIVTVLSEKEIAGL